MTARSSEAPRRAVTHRLKRLREHGLKKPISGQDKDQPDREAVLDAGWGRLIFAQTFDSAQTLIDTLRDEQRGQRDIAVYIRDPHVAMAAAPQEVFLDPSHTYRLDLATYRASRRQPKGFFVRRLCSEADARTVNAIYAGRGMVPVAPDFFWRQRDSRTLTFLVAEDSESGDILGAVTGVDHSRAFHDPERGSSLWCLAVDARAPHPGIGEALVRRLAELFQARGCAFMDLSVLHDNTSAIALYEKLNFRRAPYFTLKRKNPINEKLFIAPAPEEGLNPYARIITDEARRRGISVEVLDDEGGFFRLTHGGRAVTCRESLSELTHAVAMSRCDDKAVTRRLMIKAGVPVPKQLGLAPKEADLAASQGMPDAVADFLAAHDSVVVKPARGEQGRGVSVGVESLEDLKSAIASARAEGGGRVLIEECVAGDDLRVVVINHEVVAAALRKPPEIRGDGVKTVRALVEALSRRRSAATGGESVVPLDGETERTLKRAGYGWDDVPGSGEIIRVRRTANLHTGGALHDVTDELHPDIARSAIAASRAIDIPVVGVDFIVTAPDAPDHVFIEANERPGLANHEPQPTAERFIDLLFPLSGPR
ncbi:N-acetylglutaminylglutamine synthetase [Alkalicaulis satelles]|uniref:N-acetylglutaminylglutamine synthetase n=1 Tax=Alkalicaulis satelles TaxID=2609175 RepID=A0A5M6ZNE4_9PROT|nr:N-acetylglutaminylglutamine synthetase [Alkalicaulis satelles]KAA5804758.1 N-acetylglutaminylglutamine synthetase [Alkalicaulis satelles]